MNTVEIVAYQIKANLPRLSDDVAASVAEDVVASLERARRLLVPREKVVKKCSICPRSMRPRNALVSEYPGTIAIGAGGLCMTCYMRARGGKRVKS